MASVAAYDYDTSQRIEWLRALSISTSEVCTCQGQGTRMEHDSSGVYLALRLSSYLIIANSRDLLYLAITSYSFFIYDFR